jgi:hypothetical protein
MPDPGSLLTHYPSVELCGWSECDLDHSYLITFKMRHVYQGIVLNGCICCCSAGSGRLFAARDYHWLYAFFQLGLLDIVALDLLSCHRCSQFWKGIYRQHCYWSTGHTDGIGVHVFGKQGIKNGHCEGSLTLKKTEVMRLLKLVLKS